MAAAHDDRGHFRFPGERERRANVAYKITISFSLSRSCESLDRGDSFAISIHTDCLAEESFAWVGKKTAEVRMTPNVSLSF